MKTPYHFTLPSGRILPLVSEPHVRFTDQELEQLELVAEIGFHKTGEPLQTRGNFIGVE